MKNLKIFPKMFIQIFAVMVVIIIVIHLLVFLIFPKTYLDTRKEEISSKANEISNNMNGKGLEYIEECLDFYSKTSEIKVFIKRGNKNNEIQIKNNVDIDLESDNNSLIIEDRAITLDDGKKIKLQFVSTADMQEDAKALSFKFLPYSLAGSLLFSAIVSLIYAKSIKNNINEIKNVTDKMMELDRNARLEYESKDEIGELKEQINDLYSTLLRTIDDLDFKNKEILKLEKLKYDFFKGASHEYKDRDHYINDCIDIVDSLTKNISQIISVYSIENLKNDEELLDINCILKDVLEKYEVLANQKNIRINNHISDEKIYIGKTALKIVLSNLISNAVKYTDVSGVINIGTDQGWLYIENSYKDNEILEIDKLFEVKFDLNKENSNGLGLYIVTNLLTNYKIKYNVLQNKDTFVFKIEL